MRINLLNRGLLPKIFSHKFHTSLLALVFMLSISLMPLTNAFAISDWDSSITLTPTLTIQNETGTLSEDITHTFMSIMRTKCNSAYSSLLAATSDSNGHWAVMESRASENPNFRYVLVGWSTDPDDNFTNFYYNGTNPSVAVNTEHRAQINLDYDGNPYCGDDTYNALGLGNSWNEVSLYTSNYSTTYPAGYAGSMIPTVDDLDGDGLNQTYENGQGTSDLKKDTDGDGLSDNIEAVSYPNRDNVFCNTDMTPPYTCAYPNPVAKDVYVELDWMADTTNDYKPSSSQLNKVKDGLNDIGYNIHIDDGLYGGGNELQDYIEHLPISPDASPVGFFDFKNGNSTESISANFSPSRQGIWRYLISGYGYDEVQGSSGASYAGSDNIFLSYGTIEDDPVGFDYSDLDTAIAGTMVHEIGHSLCLSSAKKYSYQSDACVYDGVDSKVSTTYDSSMNYNLQMLEYKLSNGSNGSGDHDDWGAIAGQGIADFKDWDVSQIDFSPGVTAAQVQEAVRKGTYGKVAKGDKVYDLRHSRMYDRKENKVYTINKDRQKIGLSKDQGKWRNQLLPLLR